MGYTSLLFAEVRLSMELALSNKVRAEVTLPEEALTARI